MRAMPKLYAPSTNVANSWWLGHHFRRFPVVFEASRQRPDSLCRLRTPPALPSSDAARPRPHPNLLLLLGFGLLRVVITPLFLRGGLRLGGFELLQLLLEFRVVLLGNHL